MREKRKLNHKEILKGIIWSNFLCLILNSYYWNVEVTLFLKSLLVIDVCCYVSYIYELDLLFTKTKTEKES